MEDYRKWLQTCLAVGIPALSLDTCARLLAIVYVIGGSMEAFTHNGKLKADWEYARKRLKIEGGVIPDADGAELLRKYARELESYYENAPTDKSVSPFAKAHPEWVKRFMENRYGITGLWI
jgi:hypothetical protein